MATNELEIKSKHIKKFVKRQKKVQKRNVLSYLNCSQPVWLNPVLNYLDIKINTWSYK